MNLTKKVCVKYGQTKRQVSLGQSGLSFSPEQPTFTLSTETPPFSFSPQPASPCSEADCSQCSVFQGGDSFKTNCDQSCALCPLCSLFYIRPGCDYCNDGPEVCTRNCKKGIALCEKCC